MELNDYGRAGEEAVYRLLLVYRQRHEDRLPSGDTRDMYGEGVAAAVLADLRLFCERWGNDWSRVCEAADGLFAQGVHETCTNCHQASPWVATFENADTGATERWCDECWGGGNDAGPIYVCDDCNKGLPLEAFPDGYADGLMDTCAACYAQTAEGVTL
jgi:hypothetical protein